MSVLVDAFKKLDVELENCERVSTLQPSETEDGHENFYKDGQVCVRVTQSHQNFSLVISVYFPDLETQEALFQASAARTEEPFCS